MAARSSASHFDVENQAVPSQGARERRHIWLLQGGGLAGLVLLAVFSLGGLSHHEGEHDEKDTQSSLSKSLGHDASLAFNLAMPAARGVGHPWLGNYLRAPGAGPWADRAPGSFLPAPGPGPWADRAPASWLPAPGSLQKKMPGSFLPAPGSLQKKAPGSWLPAPGSLQKKEPGSFLPAPGLPRVPGLAMMRDMLNFPAPGSGPWADREPDMLNLPAPGPGPWADREPRMYLPAPGSLQKSDVDMVDLPAPGSLQKKEPGMYLPAPGSLQKQEPGTPVFLPAPGSLQKKGPGMHLPAPGRPRVHGLAMSMNGGAFKTILSNLVSAEELASLHKELDELMQDKQRAIELDDFAMADDLDEEIQELRARIPAELSNDLQEHMLATATSNEEGAQSRENYDALTPV